MKLKLIIEIFKVYEFFSILKRGYRVRGISICGEKRDLPEP
jgi:hypothetical protein